MRSTSDQEAVKVLVTGVTGYIGGHLAPRLVAEGYHVNALARDPSRLEHKNWQDHVEVYKGDVLDPVTLAPALEGVSAAYYLIHSMQGNPDYRERDIQAARTFSEAVKQAGVKHIVYLGGLGDPTSELSRHLQSRQQTGDALRSAGVPVTEFRAGMIVGSGSASFEMLRYLTERVPIMICPRWVFTRGQPISKDDTIDYLVAALDRPPESDGRIVEIGGRDILTYGEMMTAYARARGLRRFVIPVPVLTPRLSSYWVHLVTPISSDLAAPLIQGLRNELVVRDPSAAELFPEISPVDYATAIDRSLEPLQSDALDTYWREAAENNEQLNRFLPFTVREGMIIEARKIVVNASPKQVFDAFTSLGGDQGWLYFNWAWRLRGALDRMIGGVGLRRGRPTGRQLQVGDKIDFWRVDAVEDNRLLRLRAEMKTPGNAWLQFSTRSIDDSKTELKQVAYFAPKGLLGWIYWYAQYPLHAIMFSGILRRLKDRAQGSDSV